MMHIPCIATNAKSVIENCTKRNGKLQFKSTGKIKTN